MIKEEYYYLLFGEKATEILRKEKAKEFYDEAHKQNNIELIQGELWYNGTQVFTEFECSSRYRAKQALEMLKI